MLFLSFVGLSTYSSVAAATIPLRETYEHSPAKRSPLSPLTPLESVGMKHTTGTAPKLATVIPSPKAAVLPVPFYSQFTDISVPAWRKVGCGIASLAMLIDYYRDEPGFSVDALLAAGIESGAYNDTAGWSHAGLIKLAEAYQLRGESHSLSELSPTAALAKLTTVLEDGPVMVSVHYTFEPTNPIPHLVVVNKVDTDRVYYNDPAEPAGNNSIPTTKFLAAWKQRYIEIRPQS